MIIAAIAFHFPPTARRLPLGRLIASTALTPVTFVFTHGIAITSAWEQQGADIDGEAAGDNSGNSVSLSSDGTDVAIGALITTGNGDNSGHVRIYAWNSDYKCLGTARR